MSRNTKDRIDAAVRKHQREYARERYHANIETEREKRRKYAAKRYKRADVRAKTAADAKKRYEQRKANGLCVKCGVERRCYRLTCDRCAEKDRAASKRKYAAKYGETKILLMQKQKYRCAGCGHPTAAFAFEIDHIKPRSKGGGNELANLQVLCRLCNSVKGDRSMDYLRAKIERFPGIWGDHQLRLGRYKDIPA